MTLETITILIMSGVGLVVSTLFGIIAYFFVQARSEDKEDKLKLEENLRVQTEKLERNIERQTESLNALAKSVADLSYVIKSIQTHVDLTASNMNSTLNHHWAEIEMIRDRTHELGNWCFVLRSKAEKAGWDFKEEWHLAKMNAMLRGKDII